MNSARLAIVLCLLGALAAPPAAEAWSRWGWLRKVSEVTLASAHAADTASSWGRLEANPVLRNAQGRFGHRAVAIKVSIATGVLLVQRLGFGAPRYDRPTAISNFVYAGAIVGVAGYNWAASPPKVR